MTIRHRAISGVVDDIYQIKTTQDLEVLVNGQTRILVRDKSVLIDAHKAHIQSLVVRGAQKSPEPRGTTAPRGSVVPNGIYAVDKVMAEWDAPLDNYSTYVIRLTKVVASGQDVTFYVRHENRTSSPLKVLCPSPGYGQPDYWDNRANSIHLADGATVTAKDTFCARHRGQEFKVPARTGNFVVWVKFNNDARLREPFSFDFADNQSGYAHDIRLAQ